MLSSKCTYILTEILTRQKPVKIQYLADMFGISSRAVRYELDEIDYYLKTHNFPPILRKPNVGVFFTGEAEDQERIWELLAKRENHRMHTPGERSLTILDYCLREERITIERVSYHLDVSVSTTFKSMEALRTRLSVFDVTIKATKLQGKEMNIRRAVISVYLSSLDKKSGYDIARYIAGEKNVVLASVYLRYFEQIPKELIRESVRIFQQKVQSFLTTEDYLLYVMCLTIQITRIQMGRTMEIQDVLYIFDDNVYAAAADTKTLWEGFDIQLSEPETQFLLQTIESVKYGVVDTSENINMADLQVMIFAIFQQVQKELEQGYIYDEILLCGLREVIPDLISRAKRNKEVQQSYVRMIKEYDSKLFESVKRACMPLGVLLGKTLADDEIANVAIYFIDYFERRKIRLRQPRVVLTGLEHDAIMKLLHQRLNMIFSIDIVEDIAIYERDKLDELEVDFIISFYDIVKGAAPCLKISPFLIDEDIANLKKYLPLSFEPVVSVMEPPGERLAKCIDVDLVSLHFPNNTLTEVIEKSFEMLYEKECVGINFLQDLYATVNDIGLYSLVVPGVLFLHSRNFSFSKKLGIAIVQLDKAMVLPAHQKGLERDIKIVITLSACDEKSYMCSLQELVCNLLKQDRITDLKQAKTKEEFIKYLIKKEEEGR